MDPSGCSRFRDRRRGVVTLGMTLIQNSEIQFMHHALNPVNVILRPTTLRPTFAEQLAGRRICNRVST
jgi:hypothetical protein